MNIYIFFLGIILNNLKESYNFGPIFDNIHIYLRKSKNKHNFYLNRRIMIEI